MNRWPMIIVAIFSTMFVADAFLLYLAFTNVDPVVESYRTADR